VAQEAIARALTRVIKQSLVPWKFFARNSLSKVQPSASSQKKYIKTLTITQSEVEKSFQPSAGKLDESYNLTITKDGNATLSAVSTSGVIFGLESFTQLFYQHSSPGVGVYTPLAPVTIIDAPKYAHRGLNLDVARNWFPVSTILRTIDALSWNKYNRLHIHMTDSQSWPLDIPSIPELSEKGAYQEGLSYTPTDIQEIHTYAIARGIEIVIEFDMPGHTTAIGYAFPDLITAANAKPWTTYCNEPPCGQLKLNSSAVYTFLDKLFDDVLPRVSPYTSYFHTGGDELNAQAYLLDDTVMSSETDVIQPLLQKFVDRNHGQIRAAGLVPMVWEEMLITWNLTLGSDVVVQSWGTTGDSVPAIVEAGHQVLFGDYNFWVSRNKCLSSFQVQS
jgi:hexosaminidase